MEQLCTIHEKSRKLTDVTTVLFPKNVGYADAGSSRKLPSAKCGAIMGFISPALL